MTTRLINKIRFLKKLIINEALHQIQLELKKLLKLPLKNKKML